MSTPTPERLAEIEAKHARAVQTAENFLLEIRSDRGETAELTLGERDRLGHMTRTAAALDGRPASTDPSSIAAASCPPASPAA